MEAHARFDDGDLLSALKEVEQGSRESGQANSVESWKFKILKAEILVLRGGMASSALNLLEPEPPPTLSSGEFAVQRKLTQGRALDQLREFGKAEARFLEAEQLALNTEPRLLGDVALNQGNLLFDRNDFGRNDNVKAEQNFRKALKMARQYAQPLLEAKALGSLGRLSTRLEHYDEAIDWLVAALDVARSHHARLLEARTLVNLGWSYWELGDYEKAIPAFTDSERLSADMGLKSIRQTSLNELGNIYFVQENYPTAHDYYSQALALAKDLNDSESSAICLDNLGQVALKIGDLEQAARYNEEGLAIKRQNADRASEPDSFLMAGSIARARKEFGKAESLFLQVIHDPVARKATRWEAEAELADVYFAQRNFRLAENQFERVLGTLESVRSSLRDDEHKLAFSSLSAKFYSSYIRFLITERKPARALQIAEFSRARTLAEGLGIEGPKNPTELHAFRAQQFLKGHNQVILAYWLAPEASFLWAITPSQIRLFALPPRMEIDQRVENYKQILLGPEEVRAVDESGEELYQLLVKPAEKLIPSNARVVVIPYGSLNKLNFETLRVPGGGSHYWIEDVNVESAGSIALLTRARDRKAEKHQNLLLIGNPVQASSDYPVLAHAGDELQRVASHFPAADEAVISGKDATPSAYSSSRPGEFGLIHFVTHGTASEISPLESAIVLSQEGEKQYKLYARDIVKTPLRADAVIISACYGAGKRTYSSEGLVGLAWAFMRAGAHQVVAGLWQVDDGSTPDLMDHFYTDLRKGKSVGDALRAAKLALLHSGTQYSQPYYWASLQVYTGS